eukprot:scaffold20.g7636.t1
MLALRPARFTPFGGRNLYEHRRHRAVAPRASAPAGEAPALAAQQLGLLFGRGAAGAWDDAGVAHPLVRFFSDGDACRWFMWYSGRSSSCPNLDDVFPSSGSVGVAVSPDGIHWQRGAGAVAGARGTAKAADVGRVLAPDADSWWWHDTCHLHATDVQLLSDSGGPSGGGTGVYWMFYSGGNFEEAELPPGLSSEGEEASSSGGGGGTREGLRLRPGLAMSRDGRNWARIEAGHHTGALFDTGEEGAWDSAFIGAPQVVAAGPNDMRMYYHSYDAARRKYVVGMATSPDGFQWQKLGPVFEGGSQPGDFDERGAASRCVVRDLDSKRYFMFYESVAADGRRAIGLAVSADGLRAWQRCPAPVLEASSEPGAWDGGAVGTPWAVSMAEGRWRLYYAGRRGAHGGGWEGIGLALSREGELYDGAPTRFERRQPKPE